MLHTSSLFRRLPLTWIAHASTSSKAPRGLQEFTARHTDRRPRAPSLAVDHEDPNADGDTNAPRKPIDSSDPNAELASRVDLSAAVIYRNTGTTHHPLKPTKGYVRAPVWDLSVDVRGEHARKNTFAENEDKWKYLDEVVWPAGCTNEEGVAKKREIFYVSPDFHYTPTKMWVACEFVRGRMVDDAIAQLETVHTKGARLMIECLNEAKASAAEHDIEYPSNTWIAEATAYETRRMMGGRRVKGSGINSVRYRYSSLFIRLEEGTPPRRAGKRHELETGYAKIANYIQQLRQRRIRLGL